VGFLILTCHCNQDTRRSFVLPTEDEIRSTYRETLEDLYGFVSRRCNGDRELAEDVTQETWLRAVRAWHADGLPDRPLAWLATVAARVLSNHRRRQPMQPLVDDAALVATEPEPDDTDDRVPLMQRALARLPFAQSRLLKAFHYDERAVAEIASSAGLTERAVEGRLRRARQNLRREIEAELTADGESS
jgi:RNA polymerase sigma-70 factor, ECF subfamily